MDAEYTLVIRGGLVVDGTGAAPFEADVALCGARIAKVGNCGARGLTELDARGKLVTPGFVDIHTHLDGHVTWTERLRPSSQHGVTTVVMGNCGVGFAPCRRSDHERLIDLMEGVEDIPNVVMDVGLPWDWESFPEYLDSLDRRRFDIDVAAQIPHAPLRVYVMGHRAAAREAATGEDVAQMRELVGQALEAGALGFSTSRSLNHKAASGGVTPSYGAASDELVGIAQALKDSGRGVLQMISDFEDVDAEFEIARRMAEASGRPLSISLIQMHGAPQRWRQILDKIEQANHLGLAIKGQVSGRPIGLLFGLDLVRNPLMKAAAYQEVRELSLPDRAAALRDEGRRERILQELQSDKSLIIPKNFEELYELRDSQSYEPQINETIAARADAAGVTPLGLLYDLLTRGAGDTVLYAPAANYSANSIDAIQTMLRHPATVLGLGDSGAHCGMISDASLPTYMLLRWSEIGHGPMSTERVIKALSADTAKAVGLGDRGIVAEGYRADINIIDPVALQLKLPAMIYDLPDGKGQLNQEAIGFDATIVGGQITYRDGTATGALPGRLVRGGRPAPAKTAVSCAA